MRPRLRLSAARSPCCVHACGRVLSLHRRAPSTLMHKSLSPPTNHLARPPPLPQVRLLRSCLSTRTDTCALQFRGVRDVPFCPRYTQACTSLAAGVVEVRLMKACNIEGARRPHLPSALASAHCLARSPPHPAVTRWFLAVPTFQSEQAGQHHRDPRPSFFSKGVHACRYVPLQPVISQRAAA